MPSRFREIRSLSTSTSTRSRRRVCDPDFSDWRDPFPLLLSFFFDIRSIVTIRIDRCVARRGAVQGCGASPGDG